MTRGFTLLEVMIAMAILALSLVVIFSHQATSIDLGNEARIVTKATFLAQEKMVELIAQESLEVERSADEVKEGWPVFKWETEVDESDQEGLKKVSVLLKWKEGGRERDLRIVTYVASEE